MNEENELSEAVNALEGEQTTEQPTESLDAGGSSDSGGGLFDRLMSTEPDKPLEAIEAPIRLDGTGGLPRVWRGLQKAGMGDKMPALADILIGVIEEYIDRVDFEGDENPLGGGNDGV